MQFQVILNNVRLVACAGSCDGSLVALSHGIGMAEPEAPRRVKRMRYCQWITIMKAFVAAVTAQYDN